MQRKHILILIPLLILATLMACSNSEEEVQTNTNNKNESGNNEMVDKENIEENLNNESDEKVKITIAYQWGEGAFNERYKPIEELLGNVEIEFVPSNGTLEGFEEIFSADIQPDIFVDQNIFALQDLDVIYPLDDLIEQIGFDLDMLDQPLLDWIRAYDDEGRIIGLPDGTSNIALYYNKEVFDLFGEEYPDPEVPLTWPEIMELTRKMTAERDGSQYVGFTGLDKFVLQQFAPNATDPETGEVLINENEAFKKYFDLVEEFYSIPGISDETLEGSFQDHRAAMATATQVGLTWLAGDNPEPIEMAPYPVWPEQPTIGPLTGTTPMIIAEYSENKEIALKILEAYFEPEIILQQVRAGATAPPITDPEIYKQFAVDHEVYQGKNLDAFYVLERATRTEQVSRWDDYVDINSAVEAIKEGADVVTAMRQLEEESAAKIEEAMAAQ